MDQIFSADPSTFRPLFRFCGAIPELLVVPHEHTSGVACVLMMPHIAMMCFGAWLILLQISIACVELPEASSVVATRNATISFADQLFDGASILVVVRNLVDQSQAVVHLWVAVQIQVEAHKS